MDNENLLAHIVVSAIYIAIGAVIIWVVRKVMRPERAVTEIGKKTLVMARRIVVAFIMIILFFIVLDINGIEVSSLVTSLGAASIVAGVIIKDPVSDYFMAFTIGTRHLLQVGDTVRYKEDDAVVEELGNRLVRIRLFKDNSQVFIFNRDIQEIIKITDMNDIRVALSYDLDYRKADAVLKRVVERARAVDGVREALYKGTSSFDECSICYLIRVFCDPEKKYDMIRSVNRFIQEELEKDGIEMPYPQLDIHLIADALTEEKKLPGVTGGVTGDGSH